MRPLAAGIYKPGPYRVTNRFDQRAGTTEWECGRLWWHFQGSCREFQEAHRSGVGLVRWYNEIQASSLYGYCAQVKHLTGQDYTDVSGLVLTHVGGACKVLGQLDPSKALADLYEFVDAKRPMEPPPLQDGQVWILEDVQTQYPPFTLHTHINTTRPGVFPGGPLSGERLGIIYSFGGWTLSEERARELLHLGWGFGVGAELHPSLIYDPLNPDLVWSGP